MTSSNGNRLEGIRQKSVAGAGICVGLAALVAAGSAGAAMDPKAASGGASGGASAQTVAPGIETKASPSRFFSASRQAATFSVTIRLVRRSGNSVVKTWKRKIRSSGWHTVHWDGSVHGKMQPDGSYAFRFTAKAADGSSIRAAGGKSRSRVTMHNFAFPVHGSHTFGDPFGAPRPGGRTHQGQDIMAACGTPIVAARGGVVKHNAWQSAAGNYLVVSAQGTGEDYAYMHMPRRSHHQEGEHVSTGQQIGVVGQSGDATACHLHFELWLGKWYRGGHPVDPMPYLQTYQGYKS